MIDKLSCYNNRKCVCFFPIGQIFSNKKNHMTESDAELQHIKKRTNEPCMWSRLMKASLLTQKGWDRWSHNKRVWDHWMLNCYQKKTNQKRISGSKGSSFLPLFTKKNNKHLHGECHLGAQAGHYQTRGLDNTNVAGVESFLSLNIEK